MKEYILPFIFKNANIRGRLIYINKTIDDCFENHQYPSVIKNVMMRSLLYSLLLNSLVKIDALVTFQLQNHESLLRLVVSEIYQKKFIRAFCRYDEALQNTTIDYKTLFDGTLLSFTVDPFDDDLKRYQGLVSLNHENLDQAMIDYFMISEQSETKIKSAIKYNDKILEGSYEAVCLMIQKLPGDSVNNEVESDWERVGVFFETIEDSDLFKLANDSKSYLPRIFSEDEIVVFEDEDFFYRCRCSLEKIYSILEQMNIHPDDETQIKCEYCGKLYDNLSLAKS
jgi:molecular chaperone Hsp33